MSYAVGMQLAADAVRVATMSVATAYDGPFEVHPPVLFCEEGSTWAGGPAVARGATRPQGLVQDIVGEFTVDRLFLTAGRMLSTDDALRELLWGIVAELGQRRGAMPQAITISCPVTWNAATLARVEAIAHQLRFVAPRVIATGEDSYLAAADAFTRLPQQVAAPVVAAVDLPALQSDLRRPAPAAAPAPVVVPRATKVGSSRRAIIGSAVAVLALVAVLGLVLLRNTRASDPPSGPSSTPTSVGMVTPPVVPAAILFAPVARPALP